MMTAGVPSGDQLMVCAPALGVVSETFIRRHCKELAPGSTRFATFSVAGPDDAWPAERVSILPVLPRPWPSLPERVKNRLRPRERRYGQREVWWLDQRAVDGIVEVIEATHCEAVLLEYLDRWLNLIPSLQKAGVRSVVHGHGYDFSASLRNRRTIEAAQQLLPMADSIVVPSSFAAQRLRDLLGLTNVHVVPYGVEVPPSPTATIRNSHNIVAVGRLVPKKDPVGLIEAMARVRDKGAKFTLDLFGDGPLAAEVLKAITRLDLHDAVRMRGAQPHDAVLAGMRTAALFVQKSVTAATGDEEGLPLAILEAMAHGLPVVSTNHAGIPEAVEDERTGALVDEWDVEGFASAVVRYLKDPELGAHHGANGLDRVRNKFSWPQNRDSLRALLGLS